MNLSIDNRPLTPEKSLHISDADTASTSSDDSIMISQPLESGEMCPRQPKRSVHNAFGHFKNIKVVKDEKKPKSGIQKETSDDIFILQ